MGLARWKALVDSLLFSAQYLFALLNPQLHYCLKTKCDKIPVQFATKLIHVPSEVTRSSVLALSILVHFLASLQHLLCPGWSRALCSPVHSAMSSGRGEASQDTMQASLAVLPCGGSIGTTLWASV